MKHGILCVLLLCCSGCLVTPETFSGSLPTQHFYFEMSYTNAAWGNQHHGVYIDWQGEVYAYDHNHALWKPADPSAYTEEELRQKFARTTARLGTVEASLFRRMAALIAGAETGQYSSLVNDCRDAGRTTYVAYQFDRSRETYRPVLLYQAGDWAQKNLSEEARTLSGWLFTFEGWQPGACLP